MKSLLLRPDTHHQSGFTLIELLVVISIIGVLATTVLTSLQDARASARDATRVQTVKQLQLALEIFRNNNGGLYPCLTSTCAFVAPTHQPANQVSINGNGVTWPGLTLHRDFLARINYEPPLDSVYGIDWWGSIQYRLRSNNLTGHHGSQPNRTSYTIHVRFERSRVNSLGQVIAAGSWCSLSEGPGHVWYNDVMDTVPSNAGEVTYPLCF